MLLSQFHSYLWLRAALQGNVPKALTQHSFRHLKKFTTAITFVFYYYRMVCKRHQASIDTLSPKFTDYTWPRFPGRWSVWLIGMVVYLCYPFKKPTEFGPGDNIANADIGRLNVGLHNVCSICSSRGRCGWKVMITLHRDWLHFISRMKVPNIGNTVVQDGLAFWIYSLHQNHQEFNQEMQKISIEYSRHMQTRVI